jgi:hypothetical protein
MYVSGFDSWLFLSYYPGMKPFIIEAKRDPEQMKIYDATLKTFTENVNTKIEIYKKYNYET